MATDHGQRTAWRWSKRIVLGLLALVVVAVAGVLIVLHTDFGRGIARTQIEARLNTTFVGGASLGAVEGSPLGELVLRDLVINGPDHEPAITVKKATLELGLLPLFSKQIRVAGLHVEDVDVDLRRFPNGELQIAKLTRPGPKSGFAVQIPELRIDRAHVRFDSGTEIMNFDDLHIRGAASKPLHDPMAANLLVHGRWREREAPIWIDTIVRNSWEVLAVPSTIARVGDVTVVAAGVRLIKPQAVGFTRTRPKPMQLQGTVAVQATKEAVAALMPGVELPVDLDMFVSARPLAGAVTHVSLGGTLDGEPLRGELDVELATRRARGVIGTGVVDVAKLSGGAVEGTGSAMIVFEVRPGDAGGLPIGAVMIHAVGDLAGAKGTRAAIAVRSDGERAATAVAVRGRGVTAKVDASVQKLGERLTLEGSHIVANIADPRRATGGKAPLRGAIAVDLAARGALVPTPDLAVAGRVTGTRLRARGVSIASVKIALDARNLPARPLGRAEIEARHVVRGDVYLRELDVNAANREDGTIAVTMRTRPRQSPWLVEADALVAPGDVVTVDLVRHRVRAGSGMDWSGTHGHVEIGPDRIEVRDLVSASDDATIALAGHYHRGGREQGDLKAKIDVDAFTLDNIRKGYAGELDAHIDLARTNGKLAGTAELDATGIVLAPHVMPFDVEVDLLAGPDKLAFDARATSPRLGTARLAFDVDGPDDITNVRAWKQKHRRDIRTGRIQLEGIDVAKVAELAGLEGTYGGRVDGDLRIAEAGTGGIIRVRELHAPALRALGPVSARLDVSQPAPDELSSTLVATIDDRETAGTSVEKPLARLEAQATLGIPSHLFDPAAWRRLGKGAFKGGSVRVDDVQIEPALLDRLQVTTNLRGRASLVAEISEAARSARLAARVCELRGDPIAQPITIDLVATIDNAATIASLDVRAAPATRPGAGRGASPAVHLLDVDVRIPLTMQELQANPRAARAKPIEATAKLPDVPAARLLAVFGRTEIVGGRLSGTIDIAGTVGRPTVRARLAGTGIEVPPGPRGRPIKSIKRITLAADWDGTRGKLELDGTQDRGRLHLLAQGSPSDLAAATVRLEAKAFDLHPLLAFAPGPAGGSAGRLDADLRVTGLDPQTAKIAGELHLSRGRIPIAPQVGTMYRAKIDVVVANQAAKFALDGRIGGGSVKAQGTLAMQGAMPTGGNATLTLRDVSPIGVVQPEIDADVTTTLTKTPEAWVADVAIRNASVKVPGDKGEKLDPVGAPLDMRFVASGKQLAERPMEKRPPAKPGLIARIKLDSTYLESEELRGYVKGDLEIRSDGEAIGIVGKIEADRGDLDLFGRRYQLDRAIVRFDGTTDPLLDVLITHDFPDVTTTTQVRGRASKPELTMSSDPSTYSQGQLLGFLLGGEPQGQPAEGNPRDQATAAGTSLVANVIGGYVKDALPIDLDVLRYEAATSASGAAITVGTWITRSLFVAYRRRIEARPDENAGEGEIEYWLGKRVVVEGVIGDRGYNGVDLLWRRRY